MTPKDKFVNGAETYIDDNKINEDLHNFTQLFLVLSSDSQFRLFQFFQVFRKLIHLHHNWQQNCTEKIWCHPPMCRLEVSALCLNSGK